MSRRRTATFVLGLAVALCATAAPKPAAADGMGESQYLVKYHLVNISGAPITDPIDFTIVPPGAVVAPVELDAAGMPVRDANGNPVTLNPLTPVDPKTSLPTANFGSYDVKNLTVALGQDDPLTTQGLRLIFGSQMVPGTDGNYGLERILDASGNPVPGFLPGEANGIDFTLNLADGQTAPPLLSVRSEMAGQVSLTMSVTQVPEPISLVLWGGVAGWGYLRYRRRAA